MLASQLYAISQGIKPVESGPSECHYCSAPCDRTYRHQEPPPAPFSKIPYPCKRPANHWTCRGCMLWNRKRHTIWFLKSDEFKDGQQAKDWNWWIDEKGARAIRPEDSTLLYDRLLDPPLKFVLMLGGPPAYIQSATCNDVALVEAGTVLSFTIGLSVLEYSVYELGEALRHGTKGKMPGVQALIKLLGPHKLPEKYVKSPKGGQPPPTDKPSRVVSASGFPSAEKNR